MSSKLVMRFTTEVEGKYFSLNIDNIKQDENGAAAVTQADISTLMDLIVAKKIFETSGGLIAGKKDAKIVNTESTSYDFK